MNWFVFSLICILGWGGADVFYKASSDDSDKLSQYKIAVWVGLVMGGCALFIIPFSESFGSGATFSSFIHSLITYLPASMGYIISMIIGYVGLRYLEVSITSPIQNASGALTTVSLLVFFLISGKINDIFDEISILDIIGMAVIFVGVIALSFAERKIFLKSSGENDKKYISGAAALIFPILYCIFDTLGTTADGIILDEEGGLGEKDVLVLYGLTFFLAGAVCYLIISIREKKPYNPFAKSERPKLFAALCEEFGQIFYIYAMAENAVVAAPVVACYCVVSLILSRIFLKEKLTKKQYICVITIITGILLLGISEGLAEI